MKSVYTNNAEIAQFINRVQNKLADLSTLLVERGMEEDSSILLFIELSDFLECLDSCYCDWEEEDILRWIHEYNHRANLNSIPYINFTNFNTTILTGNNGSISLPISTKDIVDFELSTNILIKKFNHNNLSGLQGGNTDERYHITKQMYDYLTKLLNPVIESTISLSLQTSISSWPSGFFELGTSIPAITLSGSISYGSIQKADYVEYGKNNSLLGTRNSTIKKLEQPNAIVDSSGVHSDTTYSFSASFNNIIQQAVQYIRFKQPMYYGIVRKNTSISELPSKLITGIKDVRDRGEMSLSFNVPSGNTLISDNSYYCPYIFIPSTWGKFNSAINASFEFAGDWIVQSVTMNLLDGTNRDGLFIYYPTQIEGISTFKFNW